MDPAQKTQHDLAAQVRRAPALPGSRPALSGEATAKLALLRRMLRRRMLLRGAALAVLAALAGGLVSFALDRAMSLTLPQRLMIDAFCTVPAVLASWKHLWVPMRLPMDDREMALVLERRFGHLQQRLISAVQLGSERADEAGMSRQFIGRVVEQADEQTRKLDVSQAVQGRSALRAGVLGVAAVLLVAGAGLLRPELMGIYLRRHLFLQDVPWPKRTHLSVAGGPTFGVVRGGSLSVSVQALGQRPPHVSFEMKFPHLGEVLEDVEPAAGNHGGFEKTFENVSEGFEFRVSGGDDRTGWQHVRVVDPPELTNVAIRRSYPGYANKPSDDVELRHGLMAAPAGGTLEISGLATKHVMAARLKLDGHIVAEMEVSANAAGASSAPAASMPSTTAPTRSPANVHGLLPLPAHPPKSSVLLEVELAESAEIVNPRAFAVALQIEPDRPATLTMDKHGVSAQVTPQAMLPLSLTYRDDYGVKAMWIEASRATTATTAPSATPTGVAPPAASQPLAALQLARHDVALATPNDGQAQAMLDLQTLSLAPGQSLKVQAVAQDTLPAELGGPNVSHSGELVFQIVSAEDLLAELARRQKELRQEFSQAVELHTMAVARVKAGAEKIRATNSLAELPLLVSQTQRDLRSVAAQSVLSARQFQQVLDEMTYNRVITPSEQLRLSQRIIAPLAAVADKPVGQAAGLIEQAGRQNQSEPAGKALAAARAEMQRIAQQLEAALAEMKQLENRQELARALRKIIQDSEALQQELKKTSAKESPFDPK